MVRINLLPREILERRKWERWYPYVFLALAVLLAAVGIMWAFLQYQVVQKNNELQVTTESVNQLTRQAEAFAIFEQQQQQLAARQGIVNKALAGRVDMGRLAQEVSLILPDEVWVNTLSADQAAGLKMDAYTIGSAEDRSDRSFKSVAKTLVRLASLEQLYDIWLTDAATKQYTEFMRPAGAQASQNASITAVGFTPTAKIRIPVAPTAPASTVPAPPSTPGQ